MDLKLKDVTELLNISEATIKRWISDGKIPYYRLNNQYRFSRSEIETWVLSCKQGGEFSPFNEEINGGREHKHTQGIKPPGFPERGSDDKTEFGGLLVPDIVVVAGPYFKGVRTRRQVCVMRIAFPGNGRPFLVQAF